jgi:transposase InsO family protein
MISGPDRRYAVSLIEEARRSGARLSLACEVLGLSVRTYQRWTQGDRIREDRRPEASRPEPCNRLSEAERQLLLTVANSPKYRSMPPAQIVADLADFKVYLASESTFYRVLRESNQLHHRGRSAAPTKGRFPTTHWATEPNELWCWDITYLPAEIRGKYFYLYLVVDIFSRFIVGWEVWSEESAANAETLIKRTCFKEQVRTDRKPLVLHSDNGSPMKAATFRATLEKLGITSSYSRPRVSNDNAYAESLFRTLKYRPTFPTGGFANLQEAREWVQGFVHWYNEIHRHRALKFVTPGQRHRGEALEILEARQQVFEEARQQNPSRWGSRKIRDMSLPEAVCLNPDKQENAAVASSLEPRKMRQVS